MCLTFLILCFENTKPYLIWTLQRSIINSVMKHKDLPPNLRGSVAVLCNASKTRTLCKHDQHNVRGVSINIEIKKSSNSCSNCVNTIRTRISHQYYTIQKVRLCYKCKFWSMNLEVANSHPFLDETDESNFNSSSRASSRPFFTTSAHYFFSAVFIQVLEFILQDCGRPLKTQRANCQIDSTNLYKVITTECSLPGPLPRINANKCFVMRNSHAGKQARHTTG